MKKFGLSLIALVGLTCLFSYLLGTRHSQTKTTEAPKLVQADDWREFEIHKDGYVYHIRYTK